jgi:DNA helicase II / ATP-dependent DNA helicase PcrA
MISSLMDSLNKKQRLAIEKPLQPILVLAGPGTGKTRMLVARIGVLIEKHPFPPEKILALTFTNKAANEMKTRLLNQCGQKAIDVHTSTIHSFALEVLKKFHHKVGLEKNFSVCDREYQTRLMTKLCSPVIRDDLNNKVKALLLSISNFQMRSKDLTPFGKEKYNEYNSYLLKHKLIDFNQIIVFCHHLFEENKDILSEYQHLFPAILVDEFQDTDPVQYEIIKMLAAKEKNIFVVADDDQSIYAWRGANPENIKKYIEDFEISDIDLLDINYRSGDNIIDSAQRLIKDTDRVEPNKKIISLPDVLDDIKVYLFLNESDEIDFIIKKISNWAENEIAYKEIALIYPFHKIGNSLEHYFLKAKIPYQMATGNSILENPFLLKLILYLKVVQNVTDDISLEQLSENEIGIQLTKLIKNNALRQNSTFRKSLYEFYRLKKSEIDYNSLIKIKRFISQIANLVNLKSFYTLNQVIDEIYGYSQQFKYSYLNEKNNKLEKPPVLNEYFEILKNGKNDSLITIYHPNPKIEFLAAELISSVLDRTVNLFSEKKQGMDDFNNIIFELEASNDSYKNAVVIPVYKFANSKRKSSLSNLFKILQGLLSKKTDALPESYVILDLETTDKEIATCGIVEIAAARVKNGKISSELQSLINPEIPISKGAQAVHNISEKDIKNSPTLADYWKKFVDFIGDDLIIAHNGYAFDFAILDRFSKKIRGKKLHNIKLDSLAMAQNLFPNQSNSIDALVGKFHLNAGTRHRALDDVKVLNDIVNIMQNIKAELFQKTSCEIYTDIVALGNYVENKIHATEDRIFFVSGARKLISPYDNTIDQYSKKFNLDKVEIVQGLKNVITNFDTVTLSYNQDENVLYKLKLLANDFNHLPIDEAIANLINHLNLRSGGQENLEDINAVSLLTFHAAKGLEFDKVILMGLEKNSIPGFHALREDDEDERSISKKIEEQRRLLYVGITRGKSEVLLTAVKNRGGWENESSPFLKDLDVPKVVING